MPVWFPHNLAQVAAFTPLRIAFLLVVAVLARLVLHRVIRRTVSRALGHRPHRHSRTAQAFIDAASLPTGRREQRIEALASLARSAVTFVIFLITAVMVLAELGFNITSVVAGTSVVAVTVAFGLQSIVKDLFSGVFMLMEDQLGVGDYVDMEKAAGTVEGIGLRVTQLRDDEGAVWYVRNGEVLRVGNYSQGGLGRPAATELTPDRPPGAAAELRAEGGLERDGGAGQHR